ncbi:MAG: transcription termination/antitermination NusG family protein, partial [Pseudomonadota bacterium]
MAKRWYIVHAFSNFERKVKEALEERIEAHGLEVVFE